MDKISINSLYGKSQCCYCNELKDSSELMGSINGVVICKDRAACDSNGLFKNKSLVNKYVVNKFSRPFKMQIIHQDTDGVIMVPIHGRGSLDEQCYVSYDMLEKDYKIE